MQSSRNEVLHSVWARTPGEQAGRWRLAWPVSAVSAYSTPILSKLEVTCDMRALLPAGCNVRAGCRRSEAG